MDARGCPMRQESVDDVATVDRGAIPNELHPPRHLAQQVLEKPDHVGRIERMTLAVEVQLALGWDGTEGREVMPHPPLPYDRRLAYRDIGADHTGQGIEARCLYEEDDLLLRLRPFVMVGQVCSRHWVIAAVSRWRARRAGLCGLPRMAWQRRPT